MRNETKTYLYSHKLLFLLFYSQNGRNHSIHFLYSIAQEDIGYLNNNFLAPEKSFSIISLLKSHEQKKYYTNGIMHFYDKPLH